MDLPRTCSAARTSGVLKKGVVGEISSQRAQEIKTNTADSENILI